LFCAPGLVFGSVGSVSSLFHVLCSMTRFRQYRGPPVFMFCTPGLVFGGTEGVGSRFLIFRGTEGVPSRFHVFCSSTRFRRYRGRRVFFSRFALPDSFSAVPTASGPVFTFCALGLVFGDTGGLGSHFLILRARTHFRRYRGRPFPFSCFPLPDMFSAKPRASGPVFKFCALGFIFGSRTYFRRYRGRRVPFSCSALPDSFSVVSRASGLVFMFCAPRLVFGGTEVVGSRFHVLLSRICFRRYQGRRVPFTSFARPDSFSAERRASGPIFIFCAPGLVFGGTKGIRSRFHLLRSWTRFRRYRVRRVPFS
jgi:hypothetical protein